jgi:hypothetical protein
MSLKSGVSFWSVAALAGAGLCFLAATPALADMDVGKEVSTAAQHAGLAAAAKDMPAVQMHLHHTVNCLVGPKGKGFDTGVANPCKDEGNGAIPDTKDKAKKKSLRQALAKVNAGLKTKDMAKAQQDATDAQTAIKASM